MYYIAIHSEYPSWTWSLFRFETMEEVVQELRLIRAEWKIFKEVSITIKEE